MSGGQIPEHVIEAVLKHHDIVDVIGKYVHLSKSGRNMKGLCPFHSEKSPSFNVNPEKQIFKCFGCGAGGNVINFLRDVEGYSFGEAVRYLAEEANIPIEWETYTPQQTQHRKEQETLIRGHDLAARLYHYILINTEEGKEALDYLRQRGFTDPMIETFQIGFAPPAHKSNTLAAVLAKQQFDMALMEKGALVSRRTDGDYMDKFRNRIMFPIRDLRGNAIAFAGRTMGNEQPKYLNSPETMLFRKSKVMYNVHAARAEAKKRSQLVLFEGFADVIKAWHAGVHHGVGTMGTALTEDHALLIRRMAEQVIVCFDGDDAGQMAAYKSIPVLEQVGLDVKVAVLPNKQDPDDYIETHGGEQFARDIIQQALPTAKFRLLHLKRNFHLRDNDAKKRYVQTAIREVIALLEAPTEREYYLKELSSEYEQIASYESMKQEMNEVRMQQQKKRPAGDNNDNSWNNVRNDETVSVAVPQLKPAYEKAERHLLYIMMHDRDVSAYVQERLGAAFYHESHAALAAYLYAYYAQGFEPDASRYIAALQDETLERLVSSILMSESEQGLNSQVIDDYIKQIAKHRQQLEIEQMEREMKLAEGEKDYMRAAQIAIEITTLKNQLKAM